MYSRPPFFSNLTNAVKVGTIEDYRFSYFGGSTSLLFLSLICPFHLQQGGGQVTKIKLAVCYVCWFSKITTLPAGDSQTIQLKDQNSQLAQGNSWQTNFSFLQRQQKFSENLDSKCSQMQKQQTTSSTVRQ